jgi:hypothetical protein
MLSMAFLMLLSWWSRGRGPIVSVAWHTSGVVDCGGVVRTVLWIKSRGQAGEGHLVNSAKSYTACCAVRRSRGGPV